MSERRTIVICGAGGRDFHNFNCAYRDDPSVEVLAFTAAQIPGIDDRRYPPELAGDLYPNGIPIVAETDLESLCTNHDVAEVLFAYSDVSHMDLMHLASRAMAMGASFGILGAALTMLRSSKSVIAVSAVRTGCGKSQVARYLSRQLREQGRKVAVLRHPMPYGDLRRQRVQRFASLADIDAADCTIEEREEYEPHVAAGNLMFAGVDYGAILQAAESEADVILWDGGNNDMPFLRPDLHIVLVDALRPDQLDTHHPGEAVLRMADLVVINKVDEVAEPALQALEAKVARIRPGAGLLRGASPVVLDDQNAVRGKRVLIVEDGPTITHGGMPYGAGYMSIKHLRDVDIVDPRESAVGEIAGVYEKYPHIGPVLPAVGYNDRQREDLRRTIDGSAADVVVSGTPIDFARIVPVAKPVIRARYGYADGGEASLMTKVGAFLGEVLNEH